MAEKAKWRVGTKVPRNLYYGDEPIAMLETAELAQALAEKLNNAEYWVALESALQAEQQKRLDERAAFEKHAATCVLGTLTEQLQQEQQKVKDAQEAERSMRHSMDAAISDYGESQMKIAELEQKVKELTEDLRLSLSTTMIQNLNQKIESEQQKRAELEAERARLKAELKKASDNRPLHMYVWSQKPSWIAVVQARSVAEARILILEQIGGGDGTCTVRDHAAEFVKANTPDIWHGPNAEFELTDSAEVIEQVAYCERLQAELQTERALRVQAETERDSLKEAVQIIAYEPHACGSNGAVIAQDCLARLNSRKA